MRITKYYQKKQKNVTQSTSLFPGGQQPALPSQLQAAQEPAQQQLEYNSLHIFFWFYYRLLKIAKKIFKKKLWMFLSTQHFSLRKTKSVNSNNKQLRYIKETLKFALKLQD